MIDQFLTDAYVPFTIALALLSGLLALELIFALLGVTLLGAGADGADGPEIDIPETGVDLGEVDLDMDLDLELDAAGVDASELEMPIFDDPTAATDTPPTGLAAWLGFGKMPALIWLAAVLFAFGCAGFVIQSIFTAGLGSPLPAFAAAAPAAAFALWFARSFGAVFARLLPKTETESVSERHLGRRTGIVTQGTAARGRPAEVRVTDRFGNTHYLRAEPLRDDAQISQGTEVLVLRHRLTEGYLIVPLA